ncbi:hypothetical protein ABZ569_28310 [Streptomyces albus]|uniref:hypothetical protein n=1 Tax=Streptomyces albus TaxID=1888 RepID=UPI0033CA0E10
MTDDRNLDVDDVTEATTRPDNAENTSAGRVPFTVEMMELDNNPIVLQMKSY